MNRLKFLLTVLVLLVVFVSGCAVKPGKATDEMIANMMETSKKIDRLYTEMDIKTYKQNKLVSNMSIKSYKDFKANMTKDEFRIDNVVSYSYQDGDQYTIYTPYSNEVKIVHDKSLISQVYVDQKESLLQLISMLEDSHEIIFIGEEKVNGISAYHIKATPKNKKSNEMPMEEWIDMDNWLIVKSIHYIGEMKVITTYKNEINPTFSASIFTFKIPDDAKVTNVKKLEDLAYKAPKSASLSEARKKLGKSFVYYAKETPIKLSHIDLSNDIIRISYIDKAKAESAFEVAMFSSTEHEHSYDKSHALMDSNHQYVQMEEVKIRNRDGVYFDDQMGVVGKRSGYFAKGAKSKGFKYLLWTEKGVSYSVQVLEDKLTLSLLQKLINSMVIYK